jgi:hypothetical protein
MKIIFCKTEQYQVHTPGNLDTTTVKDYTDVCLASSNECSANREVPQIGSDDNPLVPSPFSFF